MLWMDSMGGVRGTISGVVGYISGGDPACDTSKVSFSSGGVCHGTVSVRLVERCDARQCKEFEVQCA